MTLTRGTDRVSISLPRDMIDYFRDLAKQEDRPFSTVIRRTLETGMMDRAQARVLVDPGVEYEVTEP